MSYFQPSSLKIFIARLFFQNDTLNEKSEKITKGCVIHRFAQFHSNGFSCTSHLLQVAAHLLCIHIIIFFQD